MGFSKGLSDLSVLSAKCPPVILLLIKIG